MTQAECEIVADAGLRLREIVRRLTIPASTSYSDLSVDRLVERMDHASLDLSEVYGALSALPLEAEGEE